MTFNWDKSTDTETSQNGLTYNLYIGTTIGGVEKMTPMANITNGHRRVVQIGNTGHRNSYTINGLTEGTYYWSVQAIDAGFKGSAFFTEQSFNVSPAFTEQTSISLSGVSNGSANWGDYDNDGDLDILLTGSHQSIIYKNNGNNTFTSISLTEASNSSAAWGDYDNDGDLDILLSGYNRSSNTTISKVYKNNCNDTFTNQTTISLTIVSDPSVAWGDYDNDGDLDILLTGSHQSIIYKNNGDNTFTEQATISLTEVSYPTVAWGDYDNDGDLDLLLSGEDSDRNLKTRIYKNLINIANTAPTAPTNLSTTANGSSVTFSWNKSTDTETPQNGLTYNLYIGSTNGGVEKMTPMANISTGFRRVAQMGNTGQRNSITINGITEGTYFWGVQAIDAGFKGSSFATMESPLPVELTSFTGSVQKGKVELKWTTATEVNNYGFEIERCKSGSGTGEAWIKISFIEGHGNSNSPKAYFFVDNNCPCGNIKYRLKQIDFDGSFEYSPEIEVNIDAPKSISLDQNYPNPFNPATTIKFTVPDYDLSRSSAPIRVTLKVYDILGREIKTIVDEFLPAGFYSYSINADEMNLTSGVYFYRLTAGNFNSSKKMILLK